LRRILEDLQRIAHVIIDLPAEGAVLSTTKVVQP
jgi:hypothetical protein